MWNHLHRLHDNFIWPMCFFFFFECVCVHSDMCIAQYMCGGKRTNLMWCSTLWGRVSYCLLKCSSDSASHFMKVLWDYRCMLWFPSFYVVPEDLNSGTHSSVAHTLSTETFPQPWNISLILRRLLTWSLLLKYYRLSYIVTLGVDLVFPVVS